MNTAYQLVASVPALELDLNSERDSSGHYKAFIDEKAWYGADDVVIKRVDFGKTVLFGQACVLVYHHVDATIPSAKETLDPLAAANSAFSGSVVEEVPVDEVEILMQEVSDHWTAEHTHISDHIAHLLASLNEPSTLPKM
ncbi:MAG: hypothetical protein Q9201_001278 [Fulgogasparrea decipioides]